MKPTLLIVLFVATTARLASAQSHQEEGAFIQGGAFASYVQRSHYDIDTGGVLALLAPTDSGSTAPGGVIGAGVFLRPFLSARADVAFTGEFDDNYPSVITTLLADLPGSSLVRSTNSRSKLISVHTLLAYHLPSTSRFRLALLGGVSFDRQRTHFNTDVFIPAVPAIPSLPVTRPIQQIDYSFVSYRRELVVGVDGEIAMGERFALIPQFRATGGSGSVTIQPGVSLRWRP